jgi:AcrR family transcriptional regulator
MPVAQTRQRLLDAAIDLFSRHGIGAVGVDAIARHSGVAKMTLYKHFESKDLLAVGALKHRHDQWATWFVRTVESKSPQPDGRLMAMFDVLHDWFCQPDFRGCLFLNTQSEISDPTSPVRQVACDHVKWLAEQIARWASDAEVLDSERVGREVTLLVAGAIITAQACHTPAPASVARAAAKRLTGH